MTQSIDVEDGSPKGWNAVMLWLENRMNFTMPHQPYRLGALRLIGEVSALTQRAEVAERERDEAKDLLSWAHDTLYEINPSNYDHDEVCKLNSASVEVILGIAPLIGEKHGKTDAWWHSRIERQRAQLTAVKSESDACWKNLVEAGRQRDEARAHIASMQAAIAEAVRRADDRVGFPDHPISGWIAEPLRPFIPAHEPVSKRYKLLDPIDELVRLLAPVLTHGRGMGAIERERDFRRAIGQLFEVRKIEGDA